MCAPDARNAFRELAGRSTCPCQLAPWSQQGAHPPLTSSLEQQRDRRRRTPQRRAPRAAARRACPRAAPVRHLAARELPAGGHGRRRSVPVRRDPRRRLA